MSRIAIDCRWITGDTGGIRRYTLSLLEELFVEDSYNEYILISLEADAAVLNKFARYSNVSLLIVNYGPFSFRSQFLLPFILKREKVSLFHSPNFMIPLLFAPFITVATVHDLIPYLYPKLNKRAVKTKLYPIYKLLMKIIIKRVDSIIAVSDWTKKDIAEAFPDADRKIRRIYNGYLNPPEISETSSIKDYKFKLPDKYILYVGRQDPSKNILGLINAFKFIKERREGYSLVIAGKKDERYPEPYKAASELGLSNDIFFTGYVSEEEMERLYRSAEVFVFPSYYEGFGLPPLEAMARALPVVVSESSSLSEIVADAALKESPDDPEAIAAAVIRVLSDRSLRDELVKRGLERVKFFSWKNAASETYRLYSELLYDSINSLRKVALAQDWLTGMRGGEKVLEEICRFFPSAPLFTMIHEKGSVSEIIEKRPVYKSLLQYLPLGKKKYRYYLPLMPLLVKSLPTEKYDLIVSTSHCVVKNLRPSRGGVHICYSHTPMRYIWDMFDDYFSPKKNLPVYLMMSFFRPYLRFIDKYTSGNVDYFIANSATTADRIRRYYRRNSEIIYPPVDTEYYTPSGDNREDYYLIVSSLVPYKRIDLAVEAFNLNKRKLKIIGTGPEEEYLKSIAGDNIEFYSWKGADFLRENYRKCRGLIFPGKEDFGIVPVEAMACGAPVVAFGEGGGAETVQDSKTGVFFYRQTPSDLNEAVKRLEKTRISPDECRRRALNFSRDAFIRRFKDFIEDKAGVPGL